MEGYKIIEVKESVFANNNKEADELRGKLKDQGIFLLNLMSSPGSGKTTTLKGTIAALKDDLKIGVMEADIDSDVDAATIEKTGRPYYSGNPAEYYENWQAFEQDYRKRMSKLQNS